MKNQGKGFTLIELLIVVAIIAILAAIAVPNFLEAQTRAKVSRAKSDLRTLATGLESYAVDYNVYPYADSNGQALWVPPGGHPRGLATGPAGLTSPIAYLTSLPTDTFEHKLLDLSGVPIQEKGPYYYEKPGFNFKDGLRVTNLQVLVPADAIADRSLKGVGADTLTLDTPERYILWSVGPDRDFAVKDANGATIAKSRYNLNNRYDPTNGTVSGGNVIRLPGGASFP